MSNTVDWQAWMARFSGESTTAFTARALEWLVADTRISAVWIVGSRATGHADAFSDTDIRIHAPGWTDAWFQEWLAVVGQNVPALVRLARFGPEVLSYECLFAENVPLDLMVFTGTQPVLAFDAVVFKAAGACERQPVPQVVKETVPTAAEVKHLVDGTLIDQQKFAKLFAREDRIAAAFLLEAQRFAVLRLAYLAARGRDPGPKAQHTLASLKIVGRVIGEEASAPIVAGVRTLVAEGSLEASAAQVRALIDLIAAELALRFPR